MKGSCTANTTRNNVTPKVSSDNKSNPLNVKRNINKLEDRQTHPTKSYTAATSNNMTVNELSDLNGLMFEIQKLKQLVNISHMIIVIRNFNLNNKLINCKDGMEKLQAFIEVSELIDTNG